MNPYSTIKSNYNDMEWRPIQGYEQFYEVSEYGDVRRLSNCTRTKKGFIPKGSVSKGGYCVVTLMNGKGKRKEFSRHYLVAVAWLGARPEGMQINHIDQNKKNNHYSNLEYVTCQENVQQSWAKTNRRDTMAHGERHGKTNLTQTDVDGIRKLLAEGVLKQREIAILYGASVTQISGIKTGRCWNLD